MAGAHNSGSSPASLDARFVAAVRQAVYGLVVEGEDPSAQVIARSLNSSQDNVERAFQRLAEGHVLILRPGTSEVLSAPPFYLEPSAYQVHTARRSYWASCIWEALGIPAALGTDGHFSAPCPDCSEELKVSVKDGRCQGEGDYVFHFLVPAARFWDDIFFT